MNEEYESLKIPGGVWGQGGTIGIPSPGIWSTQSCNSNFTAFVMSNHKESADLKTVYFLARHSVSNLGYPTLSGDKLVR